MLQQNNLIYLGAFRLPSGSLAGATYGFEYAVTGVTYNPLHNSLFINNHVYEQKTAEVSIPQPVKSTNLSSCPTATILQNSGDLAEGHLGNIGPGGQVNCGGAGSECMIGGLIAFNNRLIGTAYAAYDASKTTMYSHCDLISESSIE